MGIVSRRSTDDIVGRAAPSFRFRASFNRWCKTLVSFPSSLAGPRSNFFRSRRQTCSANFLVNTRPCPTRVDAQPVNKFLTHFLFKEPTGNNLLVLVILSECCFPFNLDESFLAIMTTWPLLASFCWVRRDCDGMAPQWCQLYTCRFVYVLMTKKHLYIFCGKYHLQIGWFKLRKYRALTSLAWASKLRVFFAIPCMPPRSPKRPHLNWPAWPEVHWRHLAGSALHIPRSWDSEKNRCDGGKLDQPQKKLVLEPGWFARLVDVENVLSF